MIKRIIKIIISLIYILFILSKNSFLRRIKKYSGDSCIVLLYHSIPDIHLNKFYRQLDYIQKKTIPVSIDFDTLSNNSKRFSILTFDDAFQSVLKNALPELYKRKIHSTIFVPTGCLGKSPEWLKYIDHFDNKEQVATLSQLQDLNVEYVTIGSHTINHFHLPELSEENAFNEIKESKVFLEKYLSYEVKYLAFPFGEYNEKILDLCKTSDYKNVFTVDPNSPYLPVSDYRRGRVAIDPWDWTLEYQLKIVGAYSWMTYFSKFKRKIKSIIKFSE